MLNIAIQESHTIRNIRSGFHKTGIWNVDCWGPSCSGLENAINQFGRESSENLEQLVKYFDKHSRYLLGNVCTHVSETGSVRVESTTGINLTSDDALEDLN